jgi:hypothetical protein
MCHRFHAPDVVLGPFIHDDADVYLLEQLFGGGWCFLEYSSDEGRVVGSPVEVLNYGRLSDFGDAVPHCLKPLEERPEGLIILAPNGFEVPWLRRLVGEGLEVGDEAATKSLQSSMQCRGRCRSHCSVSCPRTMRKYAVITSSISPAAQATVM